MPKAKTAENKNWRKKLPNGKNAEKKIAENSIP